MKRENLRFLHIIAALPTRWRIAWHTKKSFISREAYYILITLAYTTDIITFIAFRHYARRFARFLYDDEGLLLARRIADYLEAALMPVAVLTRS